MSSNTQTRSIPIPILPFEKSGSLYEVLEVARDADDNTIRKAYKRGALKYHPGT